MILATKASSVSNSRIKKVMFLQKRVCKSARLLEESDFCEDSTDKIQLQNWYFDPVDDIMETKMNTLLFTPMMVSAPPIIFDDQYN